MACRPTLLFAILLLLASCRKYKDPAPISDDRLDDRPYCNDPSAVNYNWDFPGYPDNAVCIYPTQLFSGNYLYVDTLLSAEGLPLATDTFPLQVTALDSTHLNLNGFCPGTAHTAKATRFFRFTLDSLLGNGQTFCGGKDTIAGGGTKSGIADTLTFQLQYTLQTDTGAFSHKGTAFKQ